MVKKMRVNYPHDFIIPYENQDVSDEQINQEIEKLLDKLETEPRKSLVRSVIGNVEIVVVKEFNYSDRKEYIRIGVNKNRQEFKAEIALFNEIYHRNIISSRSPDGKCVECGD